MAAQRPQLQAVENTLRTALDGELPGHAALAQLAASALHDLTQTDFFHIRRENVERELAERLRWLRRVAPLFRDGFLVLAGQRTPVQVPHEQLWNYYVPFARWLMAQARSGPGRFLVGISGIPGSGKSVMAEILRIILTPMLGAERGAGRAVVVGLDGWHFPNAYLLSHFVKDQAGNDMPLKTFKGAEFTFDAAKGKTSFAALKQQPTATLSLPAYDRQKHDPVDDAVRITADDRLVLIEGNYLLLDHGDWAGMADLFDLRVFINMDAAAGAALKEALIARHIRGGRTREDAKRHYERVDARNARVIQATMDRADVVIEKASPQLVTGIRRSDVDTRREGAYNPRAR